MKFPLSFPLQTKGFTLVETLISAFIITIVILGPLTLATSASSYSRATKDSLTATYLGQEAIELLKHQQDSIYIRCTQEAGSFCVPQSGETYANAAWRIFRNRFSNASALSCFANENPSGCSFDVVDMTANEDITPTKYQSTTNSCNTLSVEQSTNLYVCTGVRGTGTGYTPTRFRRSVSITSIPTWGVGTSEQNYNEDLRVTVTVTFTELNGYVRQIQVIDFIHPRA